MAKNAPALAKKRINKLKKVLNADSVQRQFENALDENKGAFVASVIDLYSSDNYLQQCDPGEVVMEALKAATLKLPINKQLGFAYIVPYKGKPQFQCGYKGYIQLAMRTGQYRHLNADIVPEGVEIKKDLLTGEISFEGEPESDQAQGYFAYMELLNGFSKTLYMTKEEIVAHAKRYSASYKSKSSAWHTNFDQMAMKTCMRRLLGTYGYLSTEMTAALTKDEDFNEESAVQEEIDAEANAETIDVEYEETNSVNEEQEKPEPEPTPEPEATATGAQSTMEPDF